MAPVDGYGNPIPRTRIGEPSNNLPIDLYRRLIGRIQEEDQASAGHGFSFRWDDPNSTWDSGDPTKGWDAIGLSPLIQELFYVLETMEGEDIEVLESVRALVDPLRCPKDLLYRIAASFGYALDDSLDEAEGTGDAAKRAAILGLIDAYRSRGTFVGFKVFYRLIGFEIINVFELWKTVPDEAAQDYSRVRYTTTPAAGVFIGPSGLSSFSGAVPDVPIRPGTVRITADTGGGPFVIRDEPLPGREGDSRGTFIGPSGELGTIRYATGEFSLLLAAPAVADVTATLDRVTEEWPYHAARMDLEILLSPGGSPIPLVDEQNLSRILVRMEESRPIHVLLRSVALVAEIRDDFSPGASDRTGCLQVLKDVRTGQPFPGDPGRDYTYMIDRGTAATDEMSIERVVGGTTTDHDQVFEDRAAIVCPLDALVINAGGPDMYY